MGEITEGALLGGRVRLLQPAKGHRAGTDAVLLAAAARVAPGDGVIDVGAATGAVGLMILSRVPGVRLTLAERDPALAALSERNLALNGFEARVAIVDVLDRSSRSRADLAPESADWVVTNPPFLDRTSARVSPDRGRAAAHALPAGGFEMWMKACAGLLKPKGRLVLIHRADKLRECLSALGKGFGGTRVRLVHPRADEPAIRLLICAQKGSRGPLSVEAPVILHDAFGRFTPEAEALHQGAAQL